MTHTQTPWRTMMDRGNHKRSCIEANDVFIAQTFDRAEADAEANAQLIVTAVNSHASNLALIEELAKDLHLIKRACEMQANVMRDKKRTKASDPVAVVRERVADAFDRTAMKAADALTKAKSASQNNSWDSREDNHDDFLSKDSGGRIG